MKTRFFLSLLLPVALLAASFSAGEAKAPPAKRAGAPAIQSLVTRKYCQFVLSRVDGLVRKHFYDKEKAEKVWPQALAAHKEQILAARDLAELSERMNSAIKELKASHCEFATGNDEIFYFLHSLFSSYSKKPSPQLDFTGAITGGVNCQANQVRYVLDGSPAAKAGVRVGDRLLSVNGRRYRGHLSFAGLSGKRVKLALKRGNDTINLSVQPKRQQDYDGYVEAVKASARLTKSGSATIGYVHLWSGGQASHEAFEELLGTKFKDADGLILDLRDGYGANSLEDLDFFYRQPLAYPDMTMTFRSGKKDFSRMYFDRPVVALINGGARSGKELLAFSLKRTGRARLVGERTAGAVLAGRLFDIDERCSLYLAVAAGTIGGVNLEGAGVEPGVSVPCDCSQKGKDEQLATAERLLHEAIQEAHRYRAPTFESTLDIGGRKRYYRAHPPRSPSATFAMPVVLAFHGAGQDSRVMEELSGLSELSDKYGFMVVYPDGVNHRWNDGRVIEGQVPPADSIDDVEFVSSLLDTIAARFNIDSKRIYATGFSNGGIFTQRLAGDLAGRLSAICPVAASMSEATYTQNGTRKPLAVMLIFGTADPMEPWSGGDVKVGEKAYGRIAAIPDVVKLWAQTNGCKSEPTITTVPAPPGGLSAEIQTYKSADGTKDVVLYAIQGGGHTWPGSAFEQDEKVYGKTMKQLSASETMWRFFSGSRAN